MFANPVKPSRKIYAVDLFCGAGGLTRGLLDAGIQVKAGVDCDLTCRFPYVHNNGTDFIGKSINDVTGDDLKKFFRSQSLKLLAGCAPCQTFSTYNYRARSAVDKDSKWYLLLQFSRLVTELSPELVTMENVPGLEKQGVFQKFLNTLERRNYHVSYQVVNCEEYGVPQHRHRLVLLASKLGEIRLLSPEECGAKPQTVRDAIAKLKPLAAGGRSRTDSLHYCSALSDTNLKRIRASVPGKSWREWPKALVADCHCKETGRSYSGVYGRMEWDAPSPTITTQFFGFGNGRFGHPEQDRALSLREGAILQSFPSNYQFMEPGTTLSFKAIGRLIGNAVPVRIGEVIGRSFAVHVNEIQLQKRRKHGRR